LEEEKTPSIKAIYVQFTGYIQLKQGIKGVNWGCMGVRGKAEK